MYRREFKFDYLMSRNGRALDQVLQHRSKLARTMVEEGIRGVLVSHGDDDAFISSVVDKFLARIPQFDFDPEHIEKEEDYDQIPGPLRGIFPNQMMRVWVVNFGFHYKGDIDYLRYIPRPGSVMSFPEFMYDDECMWFKAWTPDSQNRDVQKIKTEKETAIAFLQKRVADATPELEQYNQQLPSAVRVYYESLKQKYQNDKDILAQL